mmetsp:Transcript_139001/g.432428  ORF Transcript_139001/g.432428 Transcript_139001/m.432428 type:complete len:431 (+) Transcript_139001:831-2123(+)
MLGGWVRVEHQGDQQGGDVHLRRAHPPRRGLPSQVVGGGQADSRAQVPPVRRLRRGVGRRFRRRRLHGGRARVEHQDGGVHLRPAHPLPQQVQGQELGGGWAADRQGVRPVRGLRQGAAGRRARGFSSRFAAVGAGAGAAADRQGPQGGPWLQHEADEAQARPEGRGQEARGVRRPHRSYVGLRGTPLAGAVGGWHHGRACKRAVGPSNSAVAGLLHREADRGSPQALPQAGHEAARRRRERAAGGVAGREEPVCPALGARHGELVGGAARAGHDRCHRRRAILRRRRRQHVPALSRSVQGPVQGDHRRRGQDHPPDRRRVYHPPVPLLCPQRQPQGHPFGLRLGRDEGPRRGHNVPRPPRPDAGRGARGAHQPRQGVRVHAHDHRRVRLAISGAPGCLRVEPLHLRAARAHGGARHGPTPPQLLPLRGF